MDDCVWRCSSRVNVKAYAVGLPQTGCCGCLLSRGGGAMAPFATTTARSLGESTQAADTNHGAMSCLKSSHATPVLISLENMGSFSNPPIA
jgi:hypothetical protein